MYDEGPLYVHFASSWILVYHHGRSSHVTYGDDDLSKMYVGDGHEANDGDDDPLRKYVDDAP